MAAPAVLKYKTPDSRLNQTLEELAQRYNELRQEVTDAAELRAKQATMRARAYRVTSSQAITTGTWTKIQFNAETYDDYGKGVPSNTSTGMYDHQTNYRFVVREADQLGYYLAIVALRWSSVVADKRYFAAIYRSGVEWATSLSHSSHVTALGSLVMDIVPLLTIGDYVEGWGYHDSGADRNVLPGVMQTFMTVAFHSPKE